MECRPLSLRIILLNSYWVLVIMGQFTRRIIGYGIHCGNVHGPAVCRMFTDAFDREGSPRYLSTDHDPLFEFHRWKANLRILEIDEIKTIPHVPVSHPLVERLIGTTGRQFLDHLLFWNSGDLKRKLTDFQRYYNVACVHAFVGGETPLDIGAGKTIKHAKRDDIRWRSHCRGLVQLPIAA
ncbi:MAG: putative transposase [Gammaproteobacteria bacterium]